MVGTALQKALRDHGHEPIALKRASDPSAAPCWDPEDGTVHLGPSDADSQPQSVDAVVHLAGDNIGSGRWTAEKKARIIDSRVGPTAGLARTLAAWAEPPKVFVCASAIGIYGDRGTEVLTEGSALGTGFVPETCQAWEQATSAAQAAGIRTVQARIGIVLDPKGGALAKLLPPFRCGIGGVTGSGRQGMSWIGLEDTVRALLFLLEQEDLQGPVNLTAPEAVDNRELTRTLGKVLRRPTFLPVPSFAIRLLFGEMGQVLVLEGAFVKPQKLKEAGFRFRHEELDALLRAVLS